MEANLTSHAVLQQTEWSVARPRKDGYLLYNSRTDEMHLVPTAGGFAIRLCDGLRTIEEIQFELHEAIGGNANVIKAALLNFFEMLLARGIVELIDVQ